jgi:hypothetical protein
MKQTVLLRGRSKSSLQDGALVRLLVSLGQESGPGGGLEDLTDTIVGSCGALEVLVGTDLLGDVLALLLADGGLRGLGELLNHLSVVAEIDLASNENDGETLAEVKDFGNPLLLDVVKRVRGIDGEANQDDVGVGVRERAKTVVVFLTSSIPKSELDALAIHFDIGDIVLEDGGDVCLRESSLGEDNQKTSLTTGTITHDDQLAANLGHLEGKGGSAKW